MKFKRNMRNSRGWMRLVALILTSVLIFAFIFYIQTFQVSGSEQRSNWETTILATAAYDALRTLDLRDECCYTGTSDLRDYIYPNNDGNWTSLGNEIENYLPDNVGYTMYLYTSGGSVTYKAGTNTSDMPQKRDRVTVDYVLAGDYGDGCASGSSCSIYLVVWFIQ